MSIGSQESPGTELTPLEEFHNAYYYFIEAVGILASDPETQCARVGDFNVAWELKHDVLAGQYLAHAEQSIFTPTQQAAVLSLMEALETVPAETLPSGAGRESNLAAMQHGAWIPLRSKAAELINTLQSVTDQNLRYLWPPE